MEKPKINSRASLGVSDVILSRNNKSNYVLQCTSIFNGYKSTRNNGRKGRKTLSCAFTRTEHENAHESTLFIRFTLDSLFNLILCVDIF